MKGLLVLPVLLAHADGSPVGNHIRHDGMALRRTQEMEGLLVRLAPFAHADGSTVGNHLRHGGMAREGLSYAPRPLRRQRRAADDDNTRPSAGRLHLHIEPLQKAHRRRVRGAGRPRSVNGRQPL